MAFQVRKSTVKGKKEERSVDTWEGIKMGQIGEQPRLGMVEDKTEKDLESHIQEF